MSKTALTTLELWALGEALQGKASCKLSGRVDFLWSASEGTSIPSKQGQLRVGDAEHHRGSVALDAAPGSGLNPLFSLHATIDGAEIMLEGVRLRRGMPVTWQLQDPLPIKRQKPDNTRGTAALWTPGMTPKQLKDMPIFLDGKTARALHMRAVDDQMPWMLGLDANGVAVCLVNGERLELFAAGATRLERPTDAALANLRAQPHRHALSAADLRALGDALRKHKLRTPAKPARDAWLATKPFSKRLTLAFSTDPRHVLPAARGELCFGNFAEPASAVRIQGAGAANVAMQLVHVVRATRHHRFEATLHGVRLTAERPVRWAVQGEVIPKKRWDSVRDSQMCRVGFWTPGLERKARDQFDGKSWEPAVPGMFTWEARCKTPLVWMIGFDAKDRPACVLVAPRTIRWNDGEYRLGDYFAPAPRGSSTAQTLVLEEPDEPALAPATDAELEAIAAAIASGAGRTRQRITKRFSLIWDKAAIPAVKGKLRVGDPGGADFALRAGSDGPKQVFSFFDEQDDEAAGEGRAVLGVRLGDGKAVHWKPGVGLGVDSGLYGVWSPGFPTDDLDDGVHTIGELRAKIQRTAEGDTGMPSLLGLDAAKQPVAFLFGEALRPAVFQRSKRAR